MTVMSQLSALESAGLLRLAQYGPDLEYLFRHTLVQDAAYATLLSSDRQRLHRVVGEALEHLYSERLNEYAAMLARHFEQAGDAQHALAYFVRAGDAALASYANEEAEGHYRSALGLARSKRQRADLVAGLGEALYGQSRFDQAIAAWHDGIELYQTLGDLDGVARLYARSARAAWYAGDTPEGLRLCQEGLEAVARAPDSPDQARLVHEAARAYLFNGLSEQAIPLCRQALEIAERLEAVDVQADALTTLGILPGQPAEEVLAALHKAVELAEASGLNHIANRAYHNLGVMTATLVGDLRTAREHFWRATELGRKRGVVTEEILSLISVFGYSLSLGEIASAEACLADLEDLAHSLPEPEVASLEVYIARSGLSWLRGEWAEALRLQRLVRDQARQRGNLQILCNTNTEMAWLLLEIDRFGHPVGGERQAPPLVEAEEALREALELRSPGFVEQVWPRCLLSIIHARRAQFGAARQLMAEAQEKAILQPSAWDDQSLRIAATELAIAEERWSEALADIEAVAAFQIKRSRRWQWACTLLDWAMILMNRGEPVDLQRAQALLREARSAFEEMGATGYVVLSNDRLEALRAEMFARALAHGKASQELAVAGRIQEGLLPEKLPTLPGWQLAVTLEAARETCGDFYDFIPLPNGHLGIVIADVADKGAGAALYMALSRTLIRTYAAGFPAQPAQVLHSVNQRILQETHTDMFVTVFYGVLEPEPGVFTYCNAGHNPPFLLKGDSVETLTRTGLPLGIVGDAEWEEGEARIRRGEALVLYTDGVTDAQTSEGTPFGQERLLEVIQARQGLSAPSGTRAQQIEDAVLEAIHGFVGSAPRFDDLTLMVVVRECT
jgi:serine phosphatase RsbU (regulator of sigma subunit)/tetratricopeptide (TPR) repeat protein